LRLPDFIKVGTRSGTGSSFGIATGYELDSLGIESRWGRARFSAPVQTGPGTHPTSCTMGSGSIPGVKSGRGVTLTHHPFSCRGHGRVELYLYPPMDGTACTEPQCLYKGALYLFLTANKSGGARGGAVG